jgi:hypothetical protein
MSRFIVRQKNGSAPPGVIWTEGELWSETAPLSRGRQILNVAAFAQFAINPDKSLTLFDDPINGGQPQACALSRFFVGKKRLEDQLLIYAYIMQWFSAKGGQSGLQYAAAQFPS